MNKNNYAGRNQKISKRNWLRNYVTAHVIKKSATSLRRSQSPVQDWHVGGAAALARMRRTLPPPVPYPQHGKLFPDIAISTRAHPSATLFAPSGGLWRQKFCQPGSVLRTHRSSTFSCILKWRCGEKSRI